MSYFQLKRTGFKARQNVYGYILAGFSFLALTLLTVKTIVPEINVDAASQTASQTVGPYTMSMSNDSVATINITPTATQAVYTATNNLSVTNTCSAGATITMTTNSTTSNSLTRTGSDSLTKEIPATTGTALVNNSWGFSKNSGSTYAAVPKKGATAATVYDASAAQTTALPVPVMFGVKTDNSLPSGTYTNDILYTMTPKSGCNSYTLKFDLDGGTGASGKSYADRPMTWGSTIDLNGYNPTKSGYTFIGWSNGSSTFTDFSSAVNPNSSNSNPVTLTAKWDKTCTDTVFNYDYTGKVQQFTAGCDGYYKLEVWGAEGESTDRAAGGLGSYSYGTLLVSKSQYFYVYVGEKPNFKKSTNGYTWSTNAWNGGGLNHLYAADTGGSAGATDIALNGTNNSTTWNSSSHFLSRIIVAGGGAGGQNNTSRETDMGIGGNGGGFISSRPTNWSGCGAAGIATQSYGGSGGGSGATAGSFGIGGNASSDGWSTGGGGGWYGGGGGGCHTSGSGGTGYIYNSASEQYYPTGKIVNSSNYLINAGMYQYSGGAGSCISSSDVGTKTTCTSSTGHAVANAANTGNGYARITYLGTSI